MTGRKRPGREKSRSKDDNKRWKRKRKAKQHVVVHCTPVWGCAMGCAVRVVAARASHHAQHKSTIDNYCTALSDKSTHRPFVMQVLINFRSFFSFFSHFLLLRSSCFAVICMTKKICNSIHSISTWVSPTKRYISVI